MSDGAGHDIVVRRIYGPQPDGDGYRMLVDRLWPRGMSHDRARLDFWAKDMAPSADLRSWFSHRPERFERFADAYGEQLERNPQADAFVEQCADILCSRDLYLLYAAKDAERNNAVVLRDWLGQRLGRIGRSPSRAMVRQEPSR
ncbi:MAG: DUF488 family protein [Bifidobacterium sp.]|jgi:uncharacterized protein YeaO (DUF488 family)|nr:DUF488 family protein [Bifidobacterium sp.]MCI1865241.1 DUF488 family protein [Bifidobacterium sp.]